MNKLDIIKDWQKIRMHFNKSFRSNFHVSVASVNKENLPDVTPIGSLFLNRDQSGFYFEKYPTTIAQNSEVNKNVCILVVNSNMWFWLRALFKGRFKTYPAIKLYGKLGEKRKATDKEIARLNRRMKATNRLKGNKYLWQDMSYVRDIIFTHAKVTELGKMTALL